MKVELAQIRGFSLDARKGKKLRFSGHFDPLSTLYSGQAFRWRALKNGLHSGWVKNFPVFVRSRAQRLEWHSDEPLASSAVRHYFRLDRTHADSLRAIRPDAYLKTALRRFPGLRILRQDPWEVMISFIISQNSNEAKIRRTIEALCRLTGTPVVFRGAPRWQFPTPAQLVRPGAPALKATGMGYRVPYVMAAARLVHEGRLDPQELRRLPYPKAFEQLLTVPGIGEKVADCILLYGCDHHAAFPSDVWVRRFIHETYLRARPTPSHAAIRAFAWKHFGEQAGYAQQYLFHYRRAVGTLAASLA